ncbi:MAG: helix-turn-helix domain-containing protein [Sphingomonadales bacterium]|nr:helix-turn-helix domain-containing protein [Sphingomonadales bacterium]
MEIDQPPCQDQNSHSDDRITVRIPEAIRLTGLGRSKIYELIASGDIEVVKVGRCTLVKVNSLYRLINQAQRA